MKYNGKISWRWNNFIRKFFIIPKLRKRIKNKNFTLLSNNCNGGLIYHDLGIKFNSPTINLFILQDQFITFLEHLDQYLAMDLILCSNPQKKPETNYPVCNLGGGSIPLIELHFMHYNTFEEAKTKWNLRKKRINKNNLYALFAFYLDTDESWLKRFDELPIKNKIALVNKPFPKYKSAVYIPGNESNGLGVASSYNDYLGHRKYDHFDFVKWFNN